MFEKYKFSRDNIAENLQKLDFLQLNEIQ